MPSTSQLPASGVPGHPDRRLSAATSNPLPPRSGAVSRQPQQRQRNDDSWVEVSSHPSSSSMSSIGDEIDTTGLQVGSSYDPRRRRRLHPQSYAHLHVNRSNPSAAQRRPRQIQVPTSGAGSSQEEYEETESEEDLVLTSSTEIAAPSHAPRQTAPHQVFSAQGDSGSSDDDDDDDDGNATALARAPLEPFRPEPNVFSHPPSHLTHRHSASSAIPQYARRPSFGQRSRTRVDRYSPSFMSPADYQADNDAALRASLTTLLSCAAAARSRPKQGERELGGRLGPANGNQPVALRFAPESELMGPSPPPAPAVTHNSNSSARSTRPPSPSSRLPREPLAGEKIKCAATPSSGSKSPRATKKNRTAVGEETLISPTLLTWVVSAGVVVLVSVVGFGAGYVIGREVGRQETLSGLSASNLSAVSEGGSCGREVIRSSGGSLRRFRWGGGMGRSLVA
ncbi:hypothetical protein F5Y17DRAFT_223191 [Xylariaceae sp. FL0594]|nr:hypothetical protein F5Y17DRAFT_223191 [Xylariaceae sp. FL0594]